MSSQKNGVLVPYLASMMQGVEINSREAMTAGNHDPPLCVWEQLTGSRKAGTSINIDRTRLQASTSLFGAFSVVRSVSQSLISRSRPALTPPPALNPAPPLPFNHKYRVLAPGGYSIVASEVNLACAHSHTYGSISHLL